MTQNEMASAILNRITDGLSGAIANLSISTTQLMDEIDLQRADFISKFDGTKKLDLAFLEQGLDNLQIVCRPISNPGACPPALIKYGVDVPSVKVPKLTSGFTRSTLSYVGLVNKQKAFLVYFDLSEVINHKYRLRTKQFPFVWVDTQVDDNNEITLYFFNLGQYESLKYISVRGIFEHPSHLFSANPDSLDKEYPAPGHIKNMIIDALTEKYIRYFRQLNVNSSATNNEQRDLKV
jgi:hypothetical protein